MHMNMHSQPAYYAWRDVEHGDECGCMLLAQAIGVPADTVVLQAGASEALALALQPRRLPGRRALTLQLPSLELHDPVHAVLLANVPTE